MFGVTFNMLGWLPAIAAGDKVDGVQNAPPRLGSIEEEAQRPLPRLSCLSKHKCITYGNRACTAAKQCPSASSEPSQATEESIPVRYS